jgi:MFS transporter, ACDE family, multidrug resistance protein
MEPVRSIKRQNPQKSLFLNKNLQIIFGVSLMAVLGVSSITPTFGQIAQALKIPPQNVGLLITAFTLPIVIGTPIMGILADKFGRKVILVPSLFLFAIAGGLCAFVGDFNLLLILRFFQGIGAASLSSLNVTIISDLFADKQRTIAMGYNASVTAIGTSSYPLLGGALAVLGWNYPFMLPFLALPIGLLVLFSLKSPEPKNNQRLGEYLTNIARSIKNRRVLGLFFVSISTFVILYGAYVTYLPLLIAQKFQVSTFIIGIILSSMSISVVFASSQLGKLERFCSERILIRASFIFYAVALLIIPFVQNLWLLLIPTILFGIGNGIGFPCLLALLGGLAPPEYRGAFMALNGTVIATGQTLGPLLTGIAFSIWGIDGVFFATAIYSIATLLVFHFFVLRR